MRPSLEDILLGRQRARLSRVASRDLSRAQRLAAAPKDPKRAAVVYSAALRRLVIEPMAETTLRVLSPALPLLLHAEPLPAMVADRLDTSACAGCGSRAPEWYAHLSLEPARRFDAVGGPWSAAFGQLEVALSEIVEPKKLRKVILSAAESVDSLNRAELSRVLKINLREDAVLSTQIDAFLRRNVDLITSLKNSSLDRVESLVSSGIEGQLRVEELAAQIKGSFDISESRANLIARDQTLKMNADLTQFRQQRVGVEEYVWTSSNDERVRGRPGGMWEDSVSDHWILEGTTQNWLQAPVTNPKTGESNHPGQDYQCRCIAFPKVQAIIDSFGS